MFIDSHRLLLDPQGGEGGAAPAEKAPEPPAKATDFIQKYGSAEAAVDRLLSETFKLRDSNRELKAKLPPEGALVLAADDAKAWAAYRQYGDPDSVGKALDSGKAAAAERAALAREKDVARFAKANGFDADAFALVVKDGDEFVFSEETGKDGKAVAVARIKGEGDKVIPAEQRYGPLLSSLRPAAEAPRRGTPAPAGGAPQPPITPAARPAGLRLPTI